MKCTISIELLQYIVTHYHNGNKHLVESINGLAEIIMVQPSDDFM